MGMASFSFPPPLLHFVCVEQNPRWYHSGALLIYTNPVILEVSQLDKTQTQEFSFSLLRQQKICEDLYVYVIYLKSSLALTLEVLMQLRLGSWSVQKGHPYKPCSEIVVLETCTYPVASVQMQVKSALIPFYSVHPWITATMNNC